MTNQEAIDELIIVRNVYDGMREAYKPCVEAIDMAISALQKQDVPDTNVGDLISREAMGDALNRMRVGNNETWYSFYQKALDELCNLPSAQPEPCEDAVSRNAIIQKLNTMDRYVSEELVLCDTDKRFPKNEVFIVDDVYEEIVENLPSAQPELSEIKRDLSDLISRQDAINIVAPYDEGGEMRDALEDLPSAQQDIIRCKDCKMVHKYHDPFGNPIYVYVRVGDKTVSIKADDLRKALDYVTEHGEEVTIEGRGKAMVEELFDAPDAEGRTDG